MVLLLIISCGANGKKNETRTNREVVKFLAEMAPLPSVTTVFARNKGKDFTRMDMDPGFWSFWKKKQLTKAFKTAVEWEVIIRYGTMMKIFLVQDAQITLYETYTDTGTKKEKKTTKTPNNVQNNITKLTDDMREIHKECVLYKTRLQKLNAQIKKTNTGEKKLELLKLKLRVKEMITKKMKEFGTKKSNKIYQTKLLNYMKSQERKRKD
jgi:hypothetical protein